MKQTKEALFSISAFPMNKQIMNRLREPLFEFRSN